MTNSDCDCQKSKCNQSCIIRECCCKSLNVIPPECLCEDPILAKLYNELYKKILKYRFDKLLRAAVNNKDNYDKLYDKVQTAFNLPTSGLNIVITLPDGKVVIESALGNKNTFENFVNDIVAENHNTRIAILKAQLCEEGVGYETKYSSTTRLKSKYIAIRLGPYLNSAGTIRLSVPVDQS